MKRMRVQRQRLFTTIALHHKNTSKDFEVSKISRFDVYGNHNEELQKLLANFGAHTIYLLGSVVDVGIIFRLSLFMILDQY